MGLKTVIFKENIRVFTVMELTAVEFGLYPAKSLPVSRASAD